MINNTPQTTPPNPRVAALIELARQKQQEFKAKQELQEALKQSELQELQAREDNKPIEGQALAYNQALNKYGDIITYNSKQMEAIELAVSGASFVFLGAAGTGKTTSEIGFIQALLAANKLPILEADQHKHLVDGMPGIAICAYTRIATNNSKRAVSSADESLTKCCLTIHKLLEYAPVYYEVEDEHGVSKKTMRFEPTRNSFRPLSPTLRTIIIEEASMTDTELFAQILAACPHKPQFILVGDIEQLPPVFGHPILGYKLTEWPIVQLTEVYRQALESPIIKLAHHILSGIPITSDTLAEWDYPSKLKLHPWKKRISDENACQTAAAFLLRAHSIGEYNPDDDMVLIPFNKSFGTVELNKWLGTHFARRRNEITHEIIAGFNSHYFSVGDKVMYDKEDAVIESIAHNSLYTGKKYKRASPSMDYWGHVQDPNETVKESAGMTDADIDALLDAYSSSDDERKTEASHVITLRLLNSEETISIAKASEVNALLPAWALTVHKSQGSEYRKVFLLLHHTHNTMIQRELLYTAVTRAREELYCICEPDSFTKGILNQRIKGNTLEDKIAFFRNLIATKAATKPLV